MIKSVKPSGRGGKRLGSGRPSVWSTADVKCIRVPTSLAGKLLEIARYLDGQENFPREFHSFEDEESKDFNGYMAMEFSALHGAAEALAHQSNELRAEIASLRAQLKSAKKQRLRVL